MEEIGSFAIDSMKIASSKAVDREYNHVMLLRLSEMELIKSRNNDIEGGWSWMLFVIFISFAIRALSL